MDGPESNTPDLNEPMAEIVELLREARILAERARIRTVGGERHKGMQCDLLITQLLGSMSLADTIRGVTPHDAY